MGEIRRHAVRITTDALRQVRSGHPWIYDRAVTNDVAGEPGDLAVIFDDKRRFAAIGLWDPDSPIRVKVLHRGSPRQIDDGFWAERVSRAAAIRDGLRRDGRTTGFREINGENDGLPGLIVDRYGDVGVLKAYSAAWAPHLDVLVPIIADRLDLTTVVFRSSRNVRRHEATTLPDGHALVGTVPTGPVEFLEHGLRFEADVVSGQKTGHFLDQRDNRAEVGRLAAGRRVLDVFSCTGGFSTHAAAGGATSVTSVDMAPRAIDAALRHMTLNRAQTAGVRHRTVVGDAFAVMGDLASNGERFDLVVVDPPSFAQRQSSVTGARRSYARLTALALDLAAPGAILVQASCSSRISADDFEAIVREAGGRRLTITRRTEHPVDHPVTFAEGSYLKAVYAEVG